MPIYTKKACTYIGKEGMSGRHKLSMISELACENNAMIIALTETHLNEGILDCEVKIEGFNIFRADRLAAKQGGVIIYVKDNVKDLEVILRESIGNIETLVLYTKELNLVIILVYRPQTAELMNFRTMLTKMENKLESLGCPTPSIILTGDFNFPLLRWVSGTASLLESEHNQGNQLIEFASKYFLVQVVEEATRGNNILDLIFTNDEGLLLNTKIYDTVMSDHRIIMCETSLSCERHEPRNLPLSRHDLRNFNFYDVNWENFRTQLNSIDWLEEFRNHTCKEMYTILLSEISRTVSALVPLKKPPRKRIIPRDRRL